MMKYRLLIFGCIALLAPAFTSLLRAQAIPTANRSGVLQVGAGVTSVGADYTAKRIGGITAYGDFDFTSHLGVEADIHYASIITPNDFGENTYEAGGRYIFRHNRFEPYAKVMAGIGTGTFQTGTYTNNVHSTSYFIYSFGGGLDYRMPHHISLRGDFEYQVWPTFPPNNLTPNVITIGAAYRLR